MILPRLRETWHFFWEHMADLLWRLLPVGFPLLLLSQYRWRLVHEGNPEAATGDLLMMVPALMANVLGMAMTLHYAAAILDGTERTDIQPWRRALADTPRLILVQMLAGILIVGGLMLFILPGIYLMGVFLPAYVLVVREQRGVLEALREAWQRFRPGAWWLGAAMVLVMLLLLLALSGLQALANLTAALPALPQLLLCTLLEVVGLLCAQVIPILLMRFYTLEREGAAS